MPTPIHRRPTRVSLAVAALVAGVALAACGGDGSTGPRSHPAPFRVIAGGGASDTVQARLTTALIVEIHDSAGGSGVGRVVRFESLPPDDAARKTEDAVLVGSLTANTFTTFFSATADSVGQAKALIALGTVAGTARLRVSVPEFSLTDTVLYTVLPGAAVKLAIANRDTTVQPGATYSIRSSAADRLNNPVPNEPLTYTPGPGIVSVTAAGVVTVGNAIARSKIAVTWKTGSDTARVTILPRMPLVGVHSGASRVVVLVNTDATGYTELASSLDQSLSPSAVTRSGSVVYYTGNPGSNAVVSIVTPGSAPHALVPANLGFFSTQWPRWSLDGQWVYFIGNRTNAAPSVWRIHADGTGADSLGLSTSFSVFQAPTPSPDGRFVAVGDANGIRIINLATKAFQVIPVASGCAQPRYSPDGTRFVCLINGVVTVMNVDGSSIRNLSNGTNPALNFDDLAGVDWSPDGAWLIGRFGVGYALLNVSDETVLFLSAFGPGPPYTQLSFVR